jgi:phage gp46-like protein
VKRIRRSDSEDRKVRKFIAKGGFLGAKLQFSGEIGSKLKVLERRKNWIDIKKRPARYKNKKVFVSLRSLV